MMNKDMRALALQLIEQSRSACLTTIGRDGYPYSRAISNLRHEKDFSSLKDFFEKQDNPFIQYIATDTSSSKMKDIHGNPKVSLYFCDAEVWHGLMLGGDIEIVNDPSIKRVVWQEDWGRFYTQGPKDPEYSLLRLLPRTARGWHWKNTFQFDPRIMQ